MSTDRELHILVIGSLIIAIVTTLGILRAGGLI
jgi:hypothetical protein